MSTPKKTKQPDYKGLLETICKLFNSTEAELEAIFALPADTYKESIIKTIPEITEEDLASMSEAEVILLRELGYKTTMEAVALIEDTVSGMESLTPASATGMVILNQQLGVFTLPKLVAEVRELYTQFKTIKDEGKFIDEIERTLQLYTETKVQYVIKHTSELYEINLDAKIK